jgi:hypothetical protein
MMENMVYIQQQMACSSENLSFNGYVSTHDDKSAAVGALRNTVINLSRQNQLSILSSATTDQISKEFPAAETSSIMLKVDCVWLEFTTTMSEKEEKWKVHKTMKLSFQFFSFFPIQHNCFPF